MTDQALDILKLALLALVYLFFARVLWAVSSEVRASAQRNTMPAPAPAPVPHPDSSLSLGRRDVKPPRGKRGVPARLVILEPKERKGVAFAIGSGPISIGREPACTIVIPDDAFVSGHHATVAALAIEGGGVKVVIDDLGSKNGTFLNGVRVTQQHSIEAGDRIQIGFTVLEAQ